MRPLFFDIAEVFSDASGGSAPPSPSVPTAAGVEKLPVPSESASAILPLSSNQLPKDVDRYALEW